MGGGRLAALRRGGGVLLLGTGGVRERGELQEVGRARSGGVMNRNDTAAGEYRAVGCRRCCEVDGRRAGSAG